MYETEFFVPLTRTMKVESCQKRTIWPKWHINFYQQMYEIDFFVLVYIFYLCLCIFLFVLVIQYFCAREMKSFVIVICFFPSQAQIVVLVKITNLLSYNKLHVAILSSEYLHIRQVLHVTYWILKHRKYDILKDGRCHANVLMHTYSSTK